jgi:hypothetical protein
MAETRVMLAKRSEAKQSWIEAAPFLLPAIEMGDEFTPDQVLSEIESGSMQLVTFENGKAYGAVVTDGVTRGNGKKVMRIIFAGGTGMDVLLDDIVSTLKQAAQSSGCNAIEFIGRDGWLKTLAAYGFRKKAIFMEFQL